MEANGLENYQGNGLRNLLSTEKTISQHCVQLQTQKMMASEAP